MRQPDAADILRGTLDLLLLKTLTLEPMHGWWISQRIQQFSRGVLDVNQGSLYPALQRLEQNGSPERVRRLPCGCDLEMSDWLAVLRDPDGAGGK